VLVAELESRGLESTGSKENLADRIKHDDTFNAMSKHRLKEAAQERGLDKNGTKEEVLARIKEDEARVARENAEKEAAEAHLRSVKAEFADMKAPELREELEKRGLDTKGKKPELMERLAIGIEDQAQAAREMALQAIKDAKAEFAKKKPEDLKDELEKRGLDTKGKPDALMERLLLAVEEDANAEAELALEENRVLSKVEKKSKAKAEKKLAKLNAKMAKKQEQKEAKMERKEMRGIQKLAQVMQGQADEAAEKVLIAREEQRLAEEAEKIANERPAWKHLRKLLQEHAAKHKADMDLHKAAFDKESARAEAARRAQDERAGMAATVMREGMAKVGDLIANQLEVLDDELHYVLNTTLTDIQLHMESHIDRIMYFAEKKRMLFQHCYRNKAEFQTRILQAKLDGATVQDRRMRDMLQVNVLNEYLVRLGQLERIHLPKVVREGDVFLSRQNLGGYTFLEYWKKHAQSAQQIYNTLLEIDTTTSQWGLIFPNSYIEEYRGVITEKCTEWYLEQPTDFVHPFVNVPTYGDNPGVTLPECPKYPAFFWTSMFAGCDKIVRKASDMSESEDGNAMEIWVKKRHPRKRNKWSPRFLMCHGGYLEYFDTDKNIRLMRKKPKGAIPLRNVDQVMRDHKSGGFLLVTKRRVFYFKAKNSELNDKCIYDIMCAKRWAENHEDEVDDAGHAKVSVDNAQRYAGDGKFDEAQGTGSMDAMMESVDSGVSQLSWSSEDTRGSRDMQQSQDLSGFEEAEAPAPKRGGQQKKLADTKRGQKKLAKDKSLKSVKKGGKVDKNAAVAADSI
jgi:hypothetical protein